MKFPLRCICVAALVLPTAPACAQELPWEIWQSPARLAKLDPADIVLERSSHCLDGCRYDRSNPGGENDNAYPERWLYRDGDEVVVFDERGPGALTRIWLTTGYGAATCIDPQTRVRFYLDDEAVPTLDMALAALFDGSTPPFSAPLVADRFASSGGYVSQVPITYGSSLRIALLNAENGGTNPCNPDDPSRRLLWFQFQHHKVAPGTPVPDFIAGHDELAWRAFLGHAGSDPWNGMLAPQTATSTLAAGQTLTLAAHAGPGWLRGIRLQLPDDARAKVNLRIVIDGEITADMPLADFFASRAGATLPTRAVLVGTDATGWLYAWFPMPFEQDIQVYLAADSTLLDSVVVNSALSFADSPVAEESGRFHATLADDCAQDDVLLYADRGAGKLIGIAARYQAASYVELSPRGFLEGDEHAYLDDAIAPAWYGTGVEDFFNGGFYFDTGAYTAALSGATEVDASAMPYSTSVYRLLLTDPIVYASAMRLTQEAGFSAQNPQPLCVRSVAYAYRRAQPLIVGYAGFDIGDAAASTAHAYVAPADAQCAALQAEFEDEPPTSRTAKVCSSTSGSSHFRFHLDADAVPPLRLRRTFDAGCAEPALDCNPGTTAGSAAADVRINGQDAGTFSVVIANPARRWQTQEIVLDAPAGAGDLDIEIIPRYSASAPRFSESAWQLRGGWKDTVFADGFDTAQPNAAE
ncbi:MAG TPA: DUF2961 domain-containing protein [Dokdonella sp.]